MGIGDGYLGRAPIVVSAERVLVGVLLPSGELEHFLPIPSRAQNVEDQASGHALAGALPGWFSRGDDRRGRGHEHGPGRPVRAAEVVVAR